MSKFGIFSTNLAMVGASNEKEMENVNFKLIGKPVCEDCLCLIYGISDWGYHGLKNLCTINIVSFSVIHCIYVFNVYLEIQKSAPTMSFIVTAYQDNNKYNFWFGIANNIITYYYLLSIVYCTQVYRSSSIPNASSVNLEIVKMIIFVYNYFFGLFNLQVS